MGDENGEDSSVMRIGKRCYVGNLAWKTSWQDLKDKFRDVGNVVYANVMRDDGGEFGRVWKSRSNCQMRQQQFQYVFARSFAGRSKGWGIVEFETPEEVGLPKSCLICLSTALHPVAGSVATCRLVLNVFTFAGCHCCQHLQWL